MGWVNAAIANISPCSSSGWPSGHECGELFTERGSKKGNKELEYEVLRAKVLLGGKDCAEEASCICSALLGEGRSKGRLCKSGDCALASRPEALSLPGDLDWATALSMPWREIAVPLCPTGAGKASLAWFLLGLMPEGTELPRDSSRILCLRKGIMMEKSQCERTCPMGEGSCQAATNAIRLAQKESGRKFVLLARHASYSFDGASLALPVWLGAMALAKGLDASPVLATGALDENGFLLSVDGIEAKAGMRELAGARRFVYPASSTARVPSEGFPIRRKEDALFLLGEADKRFWSTVSRFGYDPMFFWYQLPVLGSWKDDETKKKWIEHAVSYAKQCGSFDIPEEEKGEVLGGVCSFMEKVKNDLDEKFYIDILNLFPLEWVNGQEKNTDIFRLCQLQITRWNTDGQDISPWTKVVEECRSAVRDSGSNVSARFLGFYARRTEDLHNKFIFECTSEVKEGIEKGLEPFEYCREQAAGEIYGMLCHGAAFGGNWEAALKMAKESQNKFGMDKAGRLQALRREFDMAYIHWDRTDENPESLHKEACRHALEYIKGSRGCVGNYPYVEALKARLRAEGAQRLGKQVSRQFLKEARSHMEQRKNSVENKYSSIHPWQFYFYNAGLACLFTKDKSQKELAIQLLRFSLDLCLHGHITIKCMALLPLSQLACVEQLESDADVKESESDVVSAAASVFKDMQDAVIGNRLNGQHFAPLLKLAKEGRVLEALAWVRSCPQDFFTFHYR